MKRLQIDFDYYNQKFWYLVPAKECSPAKLIKDVLCNVLQIQNADSEPLESRFFIEFSGYCIPFCIKDINDIVDDKDRIAIVLNPIHSDAFIVPSSQHLLIPETPKLEESLVILNETYFDHTENNEESDSGPLEIKPQESSSPAPKAQKPKVTETDKAFQHVQPKRKSKKRKH